MEGREGPELLSLCVDRAVCLSQPGHPGGLRTATGPAQLHGLDGLGLGGGQLTGPGQQWEAGAVLRENAARPRGPECSGGGEGERQCFLAHPHCPGGSPLHAVPADWFQEQSGARGFISLINPVLQSGKAGLREEEAGNANQIGLEVTPVIQLCPQTCPPFLRPVAVGRGG